MQKLSEVSEITIGQQYLTDDGVVVEAVESKSCTRCYYYHREDNDCPTIDYRLSCVFGSHKVLIFKKVE